MIDKIKKIIEEKEIRTIQVIHADTLGILGGKNDSYQKFFEKIMIMVLEYAKHH